MNKKNIKNLFFLCLFTLMICACNKGTNIEVNDIKEVINDSMFRGVTPDIMFSQLCELVGEPNEYEDKGSGDEEEHNPIYYFDDGKIICHWSGSKKDEIGVIDFIPYQNKPIYIQDVLRVPLSQYDITEKTKKLRIYEDDELYFIIYLDKLKIKEIEYWLVKKKFLNVAW